MAFGSSRLWRPRAKALYLELIVFHQRSVSRTSYSRLSPAPRTSSCWSCAYTFSVSVPCIQYNRLILKRSPNWAILTILAQRLVVNQSRERSLLRKGVHFVNDLPAVPSITSHIFVTDDNGEDVELQSMEG